MTERLYDITSIDMYHRNLKLEVRAKRDGLRRKCADLENNLEVAKSDLNRLTVVNIQLENSNQIQHDDLQSKIMLLQEELEQAKRRNNILEQERGKAEEERRKAEEERRKVEEERRKVEEERRQAEEDIKMLTTQIQEARADTKAMKRVERVEKGLEQLGAFIHGLSAAQSLSPISDMNVASQFTNLLEHIDSWVDEELYEPRSLQKLEEALTKRHPRPRLGCLDKHLQPEHVLLAEEYVTCQRPLLCSLIYRHLRCSILDETVPLREIDGQEADDVSQFLCSALSYLLQDGYREKEAGDKLHRQIIIPAMQLARTICLSPATYRIVGGGPQTTAVCKEDLQRYIMEDIVTHRMVAPENVGVTGMDGRIGERKLVVYPGLQRHHGRDGLDVLLCKPVILVDLDAALRPRSRLSY
ncbi:MAG: hypothetical protein LQ347_005990 [Umbilicaria vellea]|nr:MAG: hypothetical protein LQ347_005990 [Umbilicaria vellea]